ncbi:MAG: helix-turn-helix domain-containing protein [Polyangiaceae bacterium]|nr:helix-turn-helix domain-containing protein [Polyangiaceae bacterium]
MDDFSPPPASFPAAPPRGMQRTIAVGGGRPGVGQSTLCLNLAVYLAQLGRTVVIVDSDPSGACLHNMLGMEFPEPEKNPDPLQSEELNPLPTPVPGLSLLPQLYSRETTVPLRPGRRPRWAKGLRHLNCDYVILDLGAGTGPTTLDLFHDADLGICMTAPDPPSVEASYRFLRALFARRLRKSLLKDRFRMRQLERALESLPALPSPLKVIEAVSRFDAATARSAHELLTSLRPCLVTSKTRLRQDTELASLMASLSSRYLGIQVDSLGHIEHDDAIWLSVIRKIPLLIDNPTSKGARNLERIARRVVALAGTREASGLPASDQRTDNERSLYDILWTHRGAGDEELRRASKRQRELFQEESLPLTSLLPPLELARERGRIEEAQETLLDPVRRRTYDISFFPDATAQLDDLPPEQDEARLAEQALLRQALLHEIHPQTEYTGDLLGRIRESLGIEIEEISKKTKISGSHLRAIEEEDFENLPAEVYTRGFLRQIAALLQIDPTQATRSYIRRLRDLKQKAQEASSSTTRREP